MIRAFSALLACAIIPHMRYLLVTHIPYAEDANGSILLDRLWAQDLLALASAMGEVTVAAPRLADAQTLRSWGPGVIAIPLHGPLHFHALPQRRGRFDPTRPARLRSALDAAVAQADLVHTSNLFEPDTDLYYAHDLAVRLGKKTLFVVAEDFMDMLAWEWVRTAPDGLSHLRRSRTLKRLDLEVRRRVRSASLTFLHTPAAVSRYRLDAANAYAIRQPAHEREDVLSAAALDARCDQSSGDRPLRLVVACRLAPLKGLDMLIRSVALLRQRQITVHLDIFGDGKQAGYLADLAESLQVTGQVRFGGAIAEANELRARLNEADLFVMPHMTTDFGRAFFDAMAAGLPVVAFRSPASQDTVRDGRDGLLVSNADCEALADGIGRFAADRGELRRMSDNARRRALENTKTFWSELRAGLIEELFKPAARG